MGRANWCKHYTGIIAKLGEPKTETGEDRVCSAGVKYASVQDKSARPYRYPCIDSVASKTTCDKLLLRTPEEIEAEEKQWRDRFKNIGIARRVILATKFGSGYIDCPLCKVVGSLRFSVARSNGHVHAHCSTKDCLSWME